MKLFLIILFFIIPAYISAIEDFGGFISSGASYDSNVSTGLDDETSGKGSFKNAGDITGDLSANLYIYPLKNFYLDYFLFLSHAFQNPDYSIFSHIFEAAYQAEFNNVDLGAGFEFSHTVSDFLDNSNRIEVEPYFEVIHYQSDNSMGIYRTSFSYRKPFDAFDYYYEGYKVSASLGELFSFFDNKSSLYADSSLSLFMLENTTEFFDPVMVDKKNSHLSFSQYLRLKMGVGMFDFIPGIKYELLYFLKNDRWIKFSENSSKRRIDHLISPFMQITFNASDHFSISLSYKYYYNISTIGKEISDYYDFNYDRHKISLEIAAFF